MQSYVCHKMSEHTVSCLRGPALKCIAPRSPCYAFHLCLRRMKFVCHCLSSSTLALQLSVQLIERLQQDWVDGHLANLREEHKRFDKRCVEHESARVKHLTLKKLSKREVVERSFGDLTVARQGADEARYDLGRRLTEVGLLLGSSLAVVPWTRAEKHYGFFSIPCSCTMKLLRRDSQTPEVLSEWGTIQACSPMVLPLPVPGGLFCVAWGFGEVLVR